MGDALPQLSHLTRLLVPIDISIAVNVDTDDVRANVAYSGAVVSPYPGVPGVSAFPSLPIPLNLDWVSLFLLISLYLLHSYTRTPILSYHLHTIITDFTLPHSFVPTRAGQPVRLDPCTDHIVPWTGGNEGLLLIAPIRAYILLRPTCCVLQCIHPRFRSIIRLTSIPHLLAVV